MLFKGETSWQATLWVMVFIQGIMGVAFSVSVPFLPLFVADLGIKSPSLVDLYAGISLGVTPLAATIVSPIWGSLADRVGRKAMVVRACVGISIFTAITAVVGNIWELIVARSCQGVFSGFRGAATALVGSEVPDSKLGFSLGWMATGQLIGVLVGPLIGGTLADMLHSYRAVFVWTSVTSLICSVLAVLMVREGYKPVPRSERVHVPMRAYLGTLAREGKIFPVMLVTVLTNFAAFGVQPVISLYVKDMVGNVGWLATAAGAAFSITGVADLIASPFLGKRSDEIGYRKVMLISLVGAAVFTLLQAFSHTLVMFLVVRFGVGIFLGGVVPTANALIGRLTPSAERGRIFGLASSAMFFGQFLGPIIGGAISALWGIPTMFLVAGAGLLVNAVWVYYRVDEVDGTTLVPAS